MSNGFFSRRSAPEDKPPSPSDEIAEGIVKAVLALIAIGFLIYLLTHYF